MHEAATNYTLVKALLATGADPNAADENGDTPLHEAALNNSNCLDLLIERGGDPHTRNNKVEHLWI